MVTGVSKDIHWPDLPSDVNHCEPWCLQGQRKWPHLREVTYLLASDRIRSWAEMFLMGVCWQFMRNMQNIYLSSLYEWIDHTPKRYCTPTFNILRAFSLKCLCFQPCLCRKVLHNAFQWPCEEMEHLGWKSHSLREFWLENEQWQTSETEYE